MLKLNLVFYVQHNICRAWYRHRIFDDFLMINIRLSANGQEQACHGGTFDSFCKHFS